MRIMSRDLSVESIDVDFRTFLASALRLNKFPSTSSSSSLTSSSLENSSKMMESLTEEAEDVEGLSKLRKCLKQIRIDF